MTRRHCIFFYSYKLPLYSKGKRGSQKLNALTKGAGSHFLQEATLFKEWEQVLLSPADPVDMSNLPVSVCMMSCTLSSTSQYSKGKYFI